MTAEQGDDADQHWIVQISDRRLTMPDGVLQDDDATKSVLYCGRMVLAYTGLARMGHLSTGEWIAMALHGYATVQDALQGLAAKLTHRFRTVRASDPLGIAVASWATFEHGPVEPYIGGVANFHVLPGFRKQGTGSEFSLDVRAGAGVIAAPAGRHAEGARWNALGRAIRNVQRRTRHLSNIVCLWKRSTHGIWSRMA